MQGQGKVRHRRSASTIDDRRANFEYLFILLVRSPAGLFSASVISWTRLVGLLRPVMRSPPARFFALLQSIVLVIGALLLAPAATAQPLADEPRAEPVKREILAIYDSREEPRPDQTRIHRFAEMPLNHLGFVVSYWDVNAGLPAAERTENIRGILTWFRRAPPALFYLWGQDQVRRGVRVVVLGDSGLPTGSTTLADANRLFAEIGFGLTGAA